MPVSYAQALSPSGQASSPSLEPLCPYAQAMGICKKLNCTYLHGDICELCNRAALHPHNEELRKKHTNVIIYPVRCLDHVKLKLYSFVVYF